MSLSNSTAAEINVQRYNNPGLSSSPMPDNESLTPYRSFCISLTSSRHSSSSIHFTHLSPPRHRTTSSRQHAGRFHDDDNAEIVELQRKNIELSQKLIALLKVNQELREENASNRGTKRAYDQLVETVKSHLEGNSNTTSLVSQSQDPALNVTPLPELDPGDPVYSKVVFLWYLGQWNALLKQAKKETTLSESSLDWDGDELVDTDFTALAPGNEKGHVRVAQNINVMMRYIVDLDGKIASRRAKEMIYFHMTTKFPVLRYCSSNWKTERLWIFSESRMKKKAKTNKKPVDDNIPPIQPASTNKAPPASNEEAAPALNEAPPAVNEIPPSQENQAQRPEPPALPDDPNTGSQQNDQAANTTPGAHSAALLNLTTGNPLYRDVVPLANGVIQYPWQQPPDDSNAAAGTVRTYRNPDAPFKPSKASKTARGLCALDWFDEYYKGLKTSNPTEYKHWEAQAVPFKKSGAEGGRRARTGTNVEPVAPTNGT
ncbi:hypothetical protein C8J56DRAFT_890019 [Mycena floridula]|nr:hypothetical protein C8J56DRAFT_890019 [Mycena floridula]